MMAELVCWLHSWQELLGGIVGAVVGGGMGFVGASVVASDVRRTERRTAVRVVIADLVGFETFAKQLDRRFEDQMVDEKYRDQWLATQLSGYCYAVSPMLDHHLPQLFGADEPGLAADLMAINNHYREVRVRVEQYAKQSTSAPELTKAFKHAREAAERALTKLTPEYIEMFRRAPPSSRPKEAMP